MDQPRLAIEMQQFAVAEDIGHAGVHRPFDPVVQAAVDQFLTEFDEFLLVDGRFLVGEDEEAPAVVVDQSLDFIDHLFRIAHAVIAPEFPLRTERAGKGTSPRHVGDCDLYAKGQVDVFLPFRIDQSGSIASRSLTVGAASVATIAPPSRKANPLILRLSCGQHP